jgi:hypothetical protein
MPPSKETTNAALSIARVAEGVIREMGEDSYWHMSAMHLLFCKREPANCLRCSEIADRIERSKPAIADHESAPMVGPDDGAHAGLEKLTLRAPIFQSPEVQEEFAASEALEARDIEDELWGEGKE